MGLRSPLLTENGVCSLLGFVPYTITFGDPSNPQVVFPNNDSDGTNFGSSHEAAARLATSHFNRRDASVVPELLECKNNVTLQWDAWYDTGSLTGTASQHFMAHTATTNTTICALVGPFNDFSAVELSTLAQAAKIPHVVYRSQNTQVVSNFFSRYTTNVYPHVRASAEATVELLLSLGRTDYIALLYSFTYTNYQRRERMTLELESRGMRQHMTIAYLNPFAPEPYGGFSGSYYRTIWASLEAVRDSGFRTIVVSLYNTAELAAIADAADALGMNRGGHLWVWYDSLLDDDSLVLTETIRKLLSGSVTIQPLTSTEAFVAAWDAAGETPEKTALLDESDEETAVPFASSFYKEVPPVFGSGYIYDAVMSVGLGMCMMEEASEDSPGLSSVASIRNVTFHGATGPVSFGDYDPDTAGTRKGSSVSWVVQNVLPRNSTQLLVPVAVWHHNGAWTEQAEFVFRDGRSVPPDLLRDEPDQNHLPWGLQVFGLSLMALSILASLFSIAAVYVFRSSRVVVASQPTFLYLVSAGAIVQALAIFTLSFDEKSGWTETQLGQACMATPWLLSLGLIIVYSSLSTKMYRVHKVLQFSRRQIRIKHVIAPMIVLFMLATVSLIVWTIVDPLKWERVTMDEATGESIGKCVSDHYAAFLSLVIVLVAIPAILTGFFAWKTKDVDTAYTESGWVFILILVQLEVMMVGAPLIVLLVDLSTEGRYVGFCLMLSLFPLSTIAIIILPKLLSVRREKLGLSMRSSQLRGSMVGTTRVTGFTPGAATPLPRLLEQEHESSSQATGSMQESRTRQSDE